MAQVWSNCLVTGGMEPAWRNSPFARQWSGPIHGRLASNKLVMMVMMIIIWANMWFPNHTTSANLPFSPLWQLINMRCLLSWNYKLIWSFSDLEQRLSGPKLVKTLNCDLIGYIIVLKTYTQITLNLGHNSEHKSIKITLPWKPVSLKREITLKEGGNQNQSPGNRWASRNPSNPNLKKT